MNGRHTSGRIAAIVPPSSCFTTRFRVADTGEHIAKVAHMDYSAGDVFTDVGNAERLAACWLPDETVLYVGRAGTSLQRRVGKYYTTPMEGGLRVAGTVEFAGLEAPPEYRRARRLLEQVKQLYPHVRAEAFTEWMGHRPCMPDSLPVIGAAPGHPRLMLAFGHGHNGMTSGPVTGRLIADLVAGRAPFIDPAPYSATRF